MCFFIVISGWFWTAELQKIAPTTDRQQSDWSENGGIGQPQPDNRELQQGGARENCLAVLNNFYNDGIHWVSLLNVGKYKDDLFIHLLHFSLILLFLFSMMLVSLSVEIVENL